MQAKQSPPLLRNLFPTVLIAFLLPVLLTIFPTTAEASFFDSMKETYHKVENQIKHAINKGKYAVTEAEYEEKEETSNSPIQTATPLQTTVPLKTTMSLKKAIDPNLPDHWNTEWVVEPIFQSEIFVLQTGQENSATIVLIHGLGQVGSKDWLNVIPALEKDFHVLALDLPGFGNSAAPPGRYSPTNYAKLIHWLTFNYAKGKVIVVGHSMGGAIALRYASNFPEDINRVVLVDAAGILQRTAFIKHTAKIPSPPDSAPKAIQKLGSHIVDLGSSVIELATITPDPTILLNKNNDLWNKFFTGKPNANAALALIEEDFSQAIQNFPHHTSIIWGRNDPVAPLRTGQLLTGRLPNASIAIIDDAAHVPMNSHPEIFNEQLKRALLAGDNEITIDQNLPPVDIKNIEPTERPILTCNNETGVTYSGNFSSVEIKHCTAVTLSDITADNMLIEDSVVSIVNTTVHSAGIALTAIESVIVATNSTFSGKQGIVSDGSRLDFAGTSIQGHDVAFSIKKKSRIIMSVSDMSSTTYTGFTHGDYREKNTTLDNVMIKNKTTTNL